MSSSGAAVGFPGAKADSTGVRMGTSLVGEGSCMGPGLSVSDGGATAQADTHSIERRVTEMKRMDGSIFQAVLILTTPQRGIVWIPKNVLETETTQGSFEADLNPPQFHQANKFTT